MKYIYLILAMCLVACNDTGTSSPPTMQTGSAIRDTILVKKVVLKTVGATVKDTVRRTNDTAVILGSISNIASGNVAVCSDIMNRCAKPNKSGVYLILPKAPVLVAGRIADITDTVTTPDSIKAAFVADTLVGSVTRSGEDTAKDTVVTDSVLVNGTDTLIVDTVTVVDTIYTYDTTQTTVTIVAPTEVPVKDTISVVVDGTVMREVPINSWGHILPVGYVDKWSVEVYDTIATMSVDTVQFVYFATGDSIAQVVTLGREKIGGVFTNRFSGSFFYFWNDSAYRKDQFIHNYFIRAKDSTGEIVSKTDVSTFSAKALPATVTYLTKNVSVPQHKILPKFIPAAKNNKKLGSASAEYMDTEDTTQNWIGINKFPYPVRTVSVYDYDEYSAGLGVLNIRSNGQKINFDSLGIKRISFDVSNTTDSILIAVATGSITAERCVANTGTTIFVDLPAKGFLYSGTRKNGMYTYSEYRNVRFYFD